MCIGPLSTLMTKRATRISRINCKSEVRLVSSTQFSATSMLWFVFPTTTTRVGANARQISSITRLVNDLPLPRANGCSKINGGNSSNRGNGSPVGSGQRNASPICAQQRREFWIHHPGNCRMRVRITNRRHRRQGVNDVAERTWLDDED